MIPSCCLPTYNLSMCGSKCRNLNHELLVATRNRGKLDELVNLLQGTRYDLLSLENVNIQDEVEETGDTFEENAILKAEEYGQMAGIVTIADDSGIEVDALDGAPGVLSARYGGEELDDQDRNALLLKNLANLPDSKLTARFRCVVALSRPNQETVTFSGSVEGFITRKPRGTNGFGYDPLFYFPPKRKTLAQVSAEEKHSISHRGKAVRKAVHYLRGMVQDFGEMSS